MQIRKAERRATPALIMLYGRSGSGKTYSALKMARGMTNKKICLIDTENGRASHYADEIEFDVLDLEPPFTPKRYIQAIDIIQNSGEYGAVIIDSVSHEWEGIGGCCDMADKIGENLAAKGLSDKGLNVWAKPKAEHKKFTLNTLFRPKIPIICCARAKEEFKQVKNSEGKSEIINKGLVPVQERNLPYEMLVIFRMEGEGKFKLEKASVPELKSKITSLKSQYLDENFGKIIADWVSDGAAIDMEVSKLKEDARDAAMEGEAELKNWFKNLSDENKNIASRFSMEFKKDLVQISKDSIKSESKTAAMSNIDSLNKVDAVLSAELTDAEKAAIIAAEAKEHEQH